MKKENTGCSVVGCGKVTDTYFSTEKENGEIIYIICDKCHKKSMGDPFWRPTLLRKDKNVTT